MGRNNLIHGDLSPYNILNYNGKPFIIDFSQGLKLSSLTKSFLVRDIDNINKWFLSLGYKKIKESQEIIRDIDENL
jgi:RIO kinase 1